MSQTPAGSAGDAGPRGVRIDWYDGDRAVLGSLFAEADDSPDQVASYLPSGSILVAWSGVEPVGHLQLVPATTPGEVELKSMAVVAARRGEGIGRALVEAALHWAVETGLRRMVVATAAADVGNLRFYQRRGFRLSGVERDAFTPATGYPEPIVIDGIPLLDRVWLDRQLDQDLGSR